MSRHRIPALAAVLALVALPAKAVGVGQACSGFIGIPCDAGLWCELPDGQCGGADLKGVCVRIGAACTMEYRPVCGCDSHTYGNDCHRRLARAQKRYDGACR